MPKKTVMVVDDDAPILQLIGDILKPEGYNIVKVQSGSEALEKLKENKPDLILLDIMMPGMDGWDVCEKIKKNKKIQDIPIIFVTAKTDPISRSMGSLASVEYITKPFDMDDLKKRVKSVLNQKNKK